MMNLILYGNYPLRQCKRAFRFSNFSLSPILNNRSDHWTVGQTRLLDYSWHMFLPRFRQFDAWVGVRMPFTSSGGKCGEND